MHAPVHHRALTPAHARAVAAVDLPALPALATTPPAKEGCLSITAIACGSKDHTFLCAALKASSPRWSSLHARSRWSSLHAHRSMLTRSPRAALLPAR